jgi:hypothetical protein
MPSTEPDDRSPERKALDEKIAAEPRAPVAPLPPDAPRVPVEDLLRAQRRRPVAVAGIVENGVVRLTDPDVKLPEHARVIVVATEGV